MKNALKLEKKDVQLNLILGIVFNTESKKILLTKRKERAHITGREWCFPGGKVEYNSDLESEIKK